MGSWTVVFDLDGTLADSAPDIVFAINTLIDEQGWPRMREDDVFDFIGQGAAAEALIRASIAAAGHPLDPERIASLRARYFELYSSNLCVRTRLFDGCGECLEQLAREGCTLAVCTNKPTMLACRLLELLGIAHHFPVVCGGDAIEVCKPDPRHLIHTIEQAGGNPQRAVLIGDSVTDLKAARAAGVPVVLMSFGYATSEADAHPRDAVVDRYADLCATVERLRHAASARERAPAGCC